MSDKRKGQTQAGNSRRALRVAASDRSQVHRDALMFDAEATANVFLMTQPLSAPETAEPSVEATLIEAVLNGERDRFARLYEMYAPMVHGILLARVPRAEVDDLVQDIFLHALRKLHTLRNSDAFGGWLAMITRNRAMDFYRSSKETVEVTEKTAVAKSPNRTALEILDLIRSLPEAYRETLALRFVEGMTGPEIPSPTAPTPPPLRLNLPRQVKLLPERMGVVSSARP